RTAAEVSGISPSTRPWTFQRPWKCLVQKSFPSRPRF
ncbi:hypothetical protein AK812_SmicGene47467, partial [Symbiodinium microadriaticum]